MSLTILSVAYPATVASPGSVGGAEQVLVQLDRALVEAGHRSIVVAAEGSKVAGELVPVPRVESNLDVALPEARERHARAITEALERYPVDVVHLHGIDFYHYLPPEGVPVLATLHGPREWYPWEALHPQRNDTWLHCVSQRQQESMGENPHLLRPIENGVELPGQPSRHAKRGFASMLSRIAPEKGVHVALDAAKRADMPLLLAGQVYDYEEHRRYFAEEVAPRLDVRRRFIGPAGVARKRRLLAMSRCLLVPSLVPETSSLAAREALAMGTPVVAFATGALVDTIEHGRTGFLVSNEEEMAEAIAQASTIDPEACRLAARERFSLRRMVANYFDVYRALARSQRSRRTSRASA